MAWDCMDLPFHASKIFSTMFGSRIAEEEHNCFHTSSHNTGKAHAGRSCRHGVGAVIVGRYHHRLGNVPEKVIAGKACDSGCCIHHCSLFPSFAHNDKTSKEKGLLVVHGTSSNIHVEGALAVNIDGCGHSDRLAIFVEP